MSTDNQTTQGQPAAQITQNQNIATQQPAQIDSVSVKLPPVWPEKPQIWFAKVEAQLEFGNIKSENTKFNYLMAQLDLKIVKNIRDLVGTTEPNKYTKAKERLLTIYQESEERQLKKLISEVELGDLKPSQLLRKMRSLAGKEVSEKLIKKFWLDTIGR